MSETTRARPFHLRVLAAIRYHRNEANVDQVASYLAVHVTDVEAQLNLLADEALVERTGTTQPGWGGRVLPAWATTNAGRAELDRERHATSPPAA